MEHPELKEFEDRGWKITIQPHLKICSAWNWTIRASAVACTKAELISLMLEMEK